MGMLSARILLSHLNNRNTILEYRKEVFRPELVIRASSKGI
jgi:LacI family transcriptional regulator